MVLYYISVLDTGTGSIMISFAAVASEIGVFACCLVRSLFNDAIHTMEFDGSGSIRLTLESG